MSETKYEVTIWYDAATKPTHQFEDRQPTHSNREKFDSKEEAREYIKTELWQIDDLANNGAGLPDDRIEYGYWSKVKDRQTGKQWYQWATVQVKRLKEETIDPTEVIAE